MTLRFRTSSRTSRRAAATLIELLAGLALLSLLVTALLMTRARLIHQRASADSRLRAITAADNLLAQWNLNQSSIPRTGSGTVESDSRLTWHTHIVQNSIAANVGVQIVRLEISIDNLPATSVEVVLNADARSTTSP